MIIITKNKSNQMIGILNKCNKKLQHKKLNKWIIFLKCQEKQYKFFKELEIQLNSMKKNYRGKKKN